MTAWPFDLLGRAERSIPNAAFCTIIRTLCDGHHIRLIQLRANLRHMQQWRQPVTNRAFLLACVTVAALGVSAASSTPAKAGPADAGPRHKCSANCTIKTIISEVPGAKQAAM